VAAVCMDRKREPRTVAALVFHRIGSAAFLTFLDILDKYTLRSLFRFVVVNTYTWGILA